MIIFLFVLPSGQLIFEDLLMLLVFELFEFGVAPEDEGVVISSPRLLDNEVCILFFAVVAFSMMPSLSPFDELFFSSILANLECLECDLVDVGTSSLCSGQ